MLLYDIIQDTSYIFKSCSIWIQSKFIKNFNYLKDNGTPPLVNFWKLPKMAILIMFMKLAGHPYRQASICGANFLQLNTIIIIITNR